MFWDGLLVVFSQVGGTWENRTDELSGWQEAPSLFAGFREEGGGGRVRHCGNTPARARFAIGHNFVIWPRGGWGSSETTCQHKRTKQTKRDNGGLKRTLDEAPCSNHTDRQHKRSGGRVMRALVPRSAFSHTHDTRRRRTAQS